MAHQLFCHPPISQFLMTNIFISSMFCCINLRYYWPISNYFPSPDFIKKREKKKHTIWSVWQTIVMKLYNLVNGTGYLSELKKKKNLYVRNSKASCKFHYSYAVSRGHLSRKIKGLLLSPCSFLPLPEKGCFSFVSCF